MTRRLAVSGLALVAWVAGSILGAGPSPQHQASAATLLQIGQAHAGYVPVLDGSEPIFILVIGSDARPDQEVASQRADSIHLVGLNPAKGKAAILGLPRDSYVAIPGHGSNKINTALFYGGPDLVVQAVEQLTGIEIDYWALTGFDGFVSMINGIGGFNFDVPFPMSDDAAGAHFDAGNQHLNGRDALSFARNRHDLPMGDFGRSENQGRLMIGLLAQFRKEFTKDPSRLFTWISSGLQHLQTDVPMDQLLSLAFTASELSPKRIENLVVPGSTGTVGNMSVVNLSGTASTIYKDMANDGLVSKKNVPPSPNASLLG